MSFLCIHNIPSNLAETPKEMQSSSCEWLLALSCSISCEESNFRDFRGRVAEQPKHAKDKFHFSKNSPFFKENERESCASARCRVTGKESVQQEIQGGKESSEGYKYGETQLFA